VKAFAKLFTALDETTKTNQKVEALVSYFQATPPEDAIWAIQFLIGRRVTRLIERRKLIEWATEAAAIPAWLFDESYQAVGDMAETIALLLPDSSESTDKPLHYWVEERLLPLQKLADEHRKESLLAAWREMNGEQRFVWNKLITGSFRVGVSQSLVVRALATVSGLEPAVISHRLMGDWQPTAAQYAQFIALEADDADVSRPYPFFLAYPLEGDIAQLGDIGEWQAEWKWDGIRSQLIRRKWRTFLWSRGEELVTERFPELEYLGGLLPEGTAVDGEILPWKEGKPLPFAQLQRRIGRKVLGPKILADVPAMLIAYDLLEWNGEDIREQPLEMRREILAGLVESLTSTGRIILSTAVDAASWEQLAMTRKESRERGVEGFMLKRRGSPYRVGRKRGDWWKWKIEPFSVDAVLIYAQAGSGRRASLFTDYTFAVWDEGALVPFAKAYSGLTDEEIHKVDAFVRRNTIEKFGPVRSVKPELVFELAFEGIQKSPRHKSGIAVRFPRMARWRKDKRPEDADSLETIKALITP
jgi:DNA ligase-1